MRVIFSFYIHTAQFSFPRTKRLYKTDLILNKGPLATLKTKEIIKCEVNIKIQQSSVLVYSKMRFRLNFPCFLCKSFNLLLQKGQRWLMVLLKVPVCHFKGDQANIIIVFFVQVKSPLYNTIKPKLHILLYRM